MNRCQQLSFFNIVSFEFAPQIPHCGGMIHRLILTLFAAILCTAPLTPLGAEPEDIQAASRSVVRVVLAARDGERVVFVGHGSGFAVAPDKIVTNAHVVELAREEPGIVIGIIPSQGSSSYGGRIIAFSPGNDLALIEVQDGGRLPPMSVFSGAVADSADVTAIGYPGAVDRAQGLDFDELIQPMVPVKSRGNVSGGRSTKEFDTILHTAPIAGGNSGGPLVDNCGRVLGANSFGSTSDGNDAEFGFAVSNRELIAFLRAAGVKANLASTPCRSAAELDAEEAERLAREQANAAQSAAAKARADAANQDKLRLRAQDEIETARENWIAAAALLLALAVIAGVAAAMLLQREARNGAIVAITLAVLLLLSAVYAFFSRPGIGAVEDRMAELIAAQNPDAPPLAEDDAAPDEVGSAADAARKPMAADAGSGKFVCTIQPERSRITVSRTDDIALQWSADGCVNGRTQYSRWTPGESIKGHPQYDRDGDIWSRVFVPNQEQTVTISSFDPRRRTLVTENYLLDLDAMTSAREARRQQTLVACSASAKSQREIADTIIAVRAILPRRANERLVYRCSVAR